MKYKCSKCAKEIEKHWHILGSNGKYCKECAEDIKKKRKETR